MNTFKRKIPFNVQLIPEQYEKLKAISHKTSVPMSVMIRKAIDKIISEEQHAEMGRPERAEG